MLTKMYLTNFLSFSERTEFDFTASKYSILSDTNVCDDVLKGAMFIGPNASGKSNALLGVVFLINLIKGEGVSFENHRCVFANTQFSVVEYLFVFSGRKVNYRIEYNAKNKGLSENLTIDDIIVLKRDGNHGELRLGKLVSQDDQLDAKTLFLRTASFNTGRFPQEPVLREMMDYLFNSYVGGGYNFQASLGKTILKYAEENGIDKVDQYLKDFNYDFSVEYGSKSSGKGLNISVGSSKKMVFFKRNDFPLPMVFFDESQGNQVFVDMLPNLIRIIEAPGMLVYDEFGNSLHNKLSEQIIRYFMKNAKNSQLFFTSHHTNLISNSVLRPDQIDLISFNGKDGGSSVKRLSQFEPREAQNMEKMYLGGMFEGLPQYEEI